jgi:serine/threonine-protein kinase
MRKYSSYILFLLITILVSLLYLNNFGPLVSLQRSIHDTLCSIAAPDQTGKNVVLVTIDQKALTTYGEWPWNRDLIADLTAAVDSGKPKGILLDMDLSENSQQDSAGYTTVLADQIGTIGHVILPYEISLAQFRGSKTTKPEHLFQSSIQVDNPLGLMDETASLQVRKAFLPAERLLDAKPAIGFEYVQSDDDRIVRHQPLAMNYDGYYYPSVTLQAAGMFLGVHPDQMKIMERKEIQLGAMRTIPVNDFTACYTLYPSSTNFPKYSAADVLEDGFNFSNLQGKLVIVTVEDRSQVEFYATSLGNETPEYIIKAAAIDNIISNNLVSIRKDGQPIDLMILFIFGGACAFLLPRLKMKVRMMVLGGAVALLCGVSYYLFSSQLMLFTNVFFFLQLAFFMVAAWMVDSSLIAGPAAASATPQRKAPPKVKKEKAEGEADAPVREVRAKASDPENISTAHIDQPDHSALGSSIDIDLSTVGAESADKKSSSGKLKKSPEIISSSPSGSYKAVDNDFNPDDELEMESDSGKQEMPAEVINVKNLGRYQILGTLGKGAMGHVYKGVDPAINRPVALKTIRLDFVNDPEEMEELKERLFREAQAAGKLSHPNIVTIYDVGSEGPLQYIAMEYLEGQTLETLIKKKTQFNYRIISQIIMQICSALEYGHSQGIVHRDIKPANIMVLKDYSIKVMDYGIARVDSHSMTKTGIAMGTPNYISPEQLQGKSIDQRADLFSLGVVMYELLLGRRPFRGENITSLIYAILNQEPERPSTVNPQIPLLFDHIITRSLKKNPSERYQRAKEISADLSDFVEAFAVKK